jgi:biotin-dependent carboxylase-like uncharacterized protein
VNAVPQRIRRAGEGAPGERFLTVVDAGALTTVQDRGRPGWAHLGVPRAGALDAAAAALANRLVGNPDECAVLEATAGGVTLRLSVAMTVAVTGAEASIEVGSRPAARGEPISAPSGALLRVGPPHRGLRSYLAVAGGVDVPAVLGSRSTDTLAGLGPPPLAVGDVLAVGPPVAHPAGVDVPPPRSRGPLAAGADTGAGTSTRTATLLLHPGPRADWLDEEAPTTLTGGVYTVSEASNRVGLRLRGASLRRSDAPHARGEMPSEGLVLGAVQVPGDGQPLVFLNDHPTTGGYPVVAVVEPGCLDICAQLRPGDPVRFAWLVGGSRRGGAPGPSGS